MKDIFDLQDIPLGNEEAVSEIMNREGVRVERIVSTGQSSPPDFWYDQPEHEWVVLLSGEAGIMMDDGTVIDLLPGNYLFLPAHCKHRVDYTSEDSACIWLAVFWQQKK